MAITVTVALALTADGTLFALDDAGGILALDTEEILIPQPWIQVTADPVLSLTAEATSVTELQASGWPTLRLEVT